MALTRSFTLICTHSHSVTEFRCKSIVGYLQASIATAATSSGFVQLVQVAQQPFLIVAHQIAEHAQRPMVLGMLRMV